MTAPNRPLCIFCGSRESPTSKEHVLPHHWKKTFPSAEGKYQLRREPGSRSSKQIHQITPYDAKVSKVCQKCNSGWMRLMDEAIKPLVYSLAWGTTKSIPAHSVEPLASWCTKVALMQTHTDRDAGQEANVDLSRRFFQDRIPFGPRMIQVAHTGDAVGNVAGNTFRGLFRAQDMSSQGSLAPRLDAANLCTFRIGTFLFQVGLCSETEWSRRQMNRMLAASRIGFPNRILTLRSGHDFQLPEDPLLEHEVLLLRNITYDAGIDSAKHDNARIVR